MSSVKPGIGKGVLDPKRRPGKFRPQRFFPSAVLAEYVEHFWEVSWDLPPGERFVQNNIPYPAVHIVFEEGRSEVVGPIRGCFTREIVGSGRVVGAHIKPGMFSAFSKVSASALVDKRVPTWEVLPPSAAEAKVIEAEVLARNDASSAEYFDGIIGDWLTSDTPPACHQARDLVALVESDSTFTKADQLAAQAGISLRSLQRLFKEHVGLTPKAVIQRFRLLEAAERLVGEPTSSPDSSPDAAPSHKSLRPQHSSAQQKYTPYSALPAKALRTQILARSSRPLVILPG